MRYKKKHSKSLKNEITYKFPRIQKNSISLLYKKLKNDRLFVSFLKINISN